MSRLESPISLVHWLSTTPARAQQVALCRGLVVAALIGTMGLPGCISVRRDRDRSQDDDDSPSADFPFGDDDDTTGADDELLGGDEQGEGLGDDDDDDHDHEHDGEDEHDHDGDDDDTTASGDEPGEDEGFTAPTCDAGLTAVLETDPTDPSPPTSFSQIQDLGTLSASNICITGYQFCGTGSGYAALDHYRFTVAEDDELQFSLKWLGIGDWDFVLDDEATFLDGVTGNVLVPYQEGPALFEEASWDGVAGTSYVMTVGCWDGMEGGYTLSVTTGSESSGGDSLGWPESVIYSGADTAGLRDLATADMDGDGDVDIVSASSSNHLIKWYANSGLPTPTFTDHTVSQGTWSVGNITLTRPRDIDLADMDGDGDVDVLSAGYYQYSGDPSQVYWIENDGSALPSFSRHLVNADVNGAGDVVAADIDGDGSLDVLTGEYYAGTVSWYPNDDSVNPAFADEVLVRSGSFGIAAVAAGDLDQDGDTDVVVTDHWHQQAWWFEQNDSDDGGWTEHRITSVNDSVHAVAVADVDGDQDLDLVTSEPFTGVIAWHENDGGSPLAFTRHVLSSSMDGATALQVADMDADGSLDVLVASPDNETIYWFANNGAPSPSFSAQLVTASAVDVETVQAADLDDDGDLDIVSGSTDGTLRWYENN